MDRSPIRRARAWLVCLLVSSLASGCVSVLEQGVRELVGDEGGTGPHTPVPEPSERYGTSGRGDRPPVSPPAPAPATASIYQVAPTLDWSLGTGPRPFTPSFALFDGVAPGRIACRPVPVGLARQYSLDTGPAASPLVSLGPLELGLAAPDGTVEDASATSRRDVSARALRSGARMVGEGGLCSNRIFFYLRLGHTTDPLPMHR